MVMLARTMTEQRATASNRVPVASKKIHSRAVEDIGIPQRELTGFAASAAAHDISHCCRLLLMPCRSVVPPFFRGLYCPTVPHYSSHRAYNRYLD